MLFEVLYQIVVTVAFVTKLLNQLWNRDKVSVRNIDASCILICFVYLNFSLVISMCLLCDQFHHMYESMESH